MRGSLVSNNLDMYKLRRLSAEFCPGRPNRFDPAGGEGKVRISVCLAAISKTCKDLNYCKSDSRLPVIILNNISYV